jgi:predicted peptidase
MNHLLSAPAGRGLHPLICFLHGFDEAAPARFDKSLRRHGPFAAAHLPLLKERFVLLAPQLPHPGDFWHRYADELQKLVESVLAGGCADETRMYLTGFSFGGNGVFDMAEMQPHWWQALWSVDPTRVPQRNPDRPVWLSAGSIARVRQSSFIPALRLERNTSAARVYDDQGDDHVGAARRAYGDERIYSWLLRFSALSNNAAKAH